MSRTEITRINVPLTVNAINSLRSLPPFQSPKPSLPFRVPWVGAEHKRIVEEDILGFLGCYAMPLPVLRDVSFIPIKAGARRKGVFLGHVLYISHIYFLVKYSNTNWHSRGARHISIRESGKSG